MFECPGAKKKNLIKNKMKKNIRKKWNKSKINKPRGVRKRKINIGNWPEFWNEIIGTSKWITNLRQLIEKGIGALIIQMINIELTIHTSV